MEIRDFVRRILEERYFVKDVEGKVIEDERGMCERVAYYVAEGNRQYGYSSTDIEHIAQTYFRLMWDQLFIPNSPTLMGANTPLGQLSACISGDTLIFTKDGLKPMCEIKQGDRVLTHTGNFRKVVKIWSNGVKPTLHLIQGNNKRRKKFNLTATHDHKILLSNGEWATASNLQGKEIALPQLWKSNSPFPEYFDMTQYAKGITKQVVSLGGRVWEVNTDQRKRSAVLSNQGTHCKSHIKNTPQLARIFGRYLADGSIGNTCVRFCVNSKDEEGIALLLKSLKESFGVEPSCCKSSSGNWCDIRVWNRFVKNLFISLFGQGFKTKKLPEWISNADIDYRQQMFNGIMEDGYSNNTISRLVLANPTLVYQSLLLARSLGMSGHFTADARASLSKNPTSGAVFSKSACMNNVFIEQGNEVEVFDMEVEKDHSFVAGDFIVHNCFVLPIRDSLDSIYTTLGNAAKVYQSGGGVGFSFSRLRPQGDLVRSSKGVASGPVSFMDVFNASAEAIKQGGTRRAASMAVLRVDHPDILQFIRCKDDTSRLNSFNISVGLTDNFLEAVENDGMFDLVNPTTQQTVESRPARQIWEILIESAWKTGEPGILFLDRINRRNPNNHCEVIESCNPCWSGDTKVWTIYGPKSFKQLVKEGKDVPVLSQTKSGKLVFKMMRDICCTKHGAKALQVTLDDGTVLTCTPNHNIYLRSGSKIQAKDLKPGDSIASVYRSKANQKQYFRLVNGIESPLEHHVVVSYNEGKRPKYPEEHTHHIDGNKLNNTPENLEIVDASQHNHDHMIGENNPMFGVWDERNPLFGRPVAGKDNPRYRHDIDTRKVIYLRKRFKLSTRALGKIFKCSKPTVRKRLREAGVAINHKVVSVISHTKTMDVYNGTVDDTHNYFVMCNKGAILSANCGELPLPPYGSCNLGSINLSKFVVNPYKDCAYLDMNKLRDTVATAVKFLDNVIDVNRYPLPELEKQAKQDRRIGLGIMGLHEMLIQLSLPYNSIEAQQFVSHTLMRAIKDIALRTSMWLAERRGVYPQWEGSQWEKSGIRVRNATLTTVAPTGTISMIASTPYMPVSGGIEPKFGLVFTRYQADRHILDIDAQFEDVARREGFYSDELMKKIANNHGSCQFIEEVPEKWRKLFVTAHDISPEDHVYMQAAVQSGDDSTVLTQLVDSSVSKTINFPSNATVDDVSRAYALANKLGLKGITVYRDQCRDNQVFSTGFTSPEVHTADFCPEGGTIKKEGGCISCTCGWSVCSIS